MSPRPRTVADDKIIEAAAKVIGRVGPGNLTLADVGKEAGLSAATLVQRFGSKRGLLLAMATSAAESMEACFEMVRAAHPSPLAQGAFFGSRPFSRANAALEAAGRGGIDWRLEP